MTLTIPTYSQDTTIEEFMAQVDQQNATLEAQLEEALRLLPPDFLANYKELTARHDSLLNRMVNGEYDDLANLLEERLNVEIEMMELCQRAADLRDVKNT